MKNLRKGLCSFYPLCSFPLLFLGFCCLLFLAPGRVWSQQEDLLTVPRIELERLRETLRWSSTQLQEHESTIQSLLGQLQQAERLRRILDQSLSEQQLSLRMLEDELAVSEQSLTAASRGLIQSLEQITILTNQAARNQTLATIFGTGFALATVTLIVVILGGR